MQLSVTSNWRLADRFQGLEGKKPRYRCGSAKDITRRERGQRQPFVAEYFQDHEYLATGRRYAASAVRWTHQGYEWVCQLFVGIRPRTRPSRHNASPRWLQPDAVAARSIQFDACWLPGSKLAQLITMLMQPDGRTVDELSQALGWQLHTTRAVISRLQKSGHVVVRAKNDAGQNVYRIEAAAGLSSSAPRRLYAVR